eukprot:g3061.t1
MHFSDLPCFVQKGANYFELASNSQHTSSGCNPPSSSCVNNTHNQQQHCTAMLNNDMNTEITEPKFYQGMLQEEQKMPCCDGNHFEQKHKQEVCYQEQQQTTSTSALNISRHMAYRGAAATNHRQSNVTNNTNNKNILPCGKAFNDPAFASQINCVGLAPGWFQISANEFGSDKGERHICDHTCQLQRWVPDVSMFQCAITKRPRRKYPYNGFSITAMEEASSQQQHQPSGQQPLYEQTSKVLFGDANKTYQQHSIYNNATPMDKHAVMRQHQQQRKRSRADATITPPLVTHKKKYEDTTSNTPTFIDTSDMACAQGWGLDQDMYTTTTSANSQQMNVNESSNTLPLSRKRSNRVYPECKDMNTASSSCFPGDNIGFGSQYRSAKRRCSRECPPTMMPNGGIHHNYQMNTTGASFGANKTLQQQNAARQKQSGFSFFPSHVRQEGQQQYDSERNVRAPAVEKSTTAKVTFPSSSKNTQKPRWNRHLNIAADNLIIQGKLGFVSEQLAKPEAILEEPNVNNNHPRGHRENATWFSMAGVMMTDCVGTGVLSLTLVPQQLGWLPAVILLVCVFFLNLIAARWMKITRDTLLKRSRKGIYTNEEPCSYSGMFFRTAGYNNFFYWMIVVWVYFIQGFFVMVTYIILFGDTLVSFFESVGVPNFCRWQAQLIGFAVVYPLGILIRSLNGLRYITWINFFLILVTVVISLISIGLNGVASGRSVYMIAPNSNDIKSIGNSIALSFFAYSGQWCYVEVMYEMGDNADDFLKTFAINGPLQIILYLAVALVPYFFLGTTVAADQTYLLSNVESGPLLAVASMALFLHVVVTFFQTNIIVTRIPQLVAAQYILGVDDFDETRASLTISMSRDESSASIVLPYHLFSLRTLLYMVVNLLVYFVAFLIANAIPYFTILNGLFGAVLEPFTSFIFPAIMLILVKAYHPSFQEENYQNSYDDDDEQLSNSCDQEKRKTCDKEKLTNSCDQENQRCDDHDSIGLRTTSLSSDGNIILSDVVRSFSDVKWKFSIEDLYRKISVFEGLTMSLIVLAAIFTAIFGTW